ncbi:MAG TPA: BON domain-containing protein [Burkholderiaceae bacterium]|nr:BON domain-containing protein [Burkholderiaceae bacterium]
MPTSVLRRSAVALERNAVALERNAVPLKLGSVPLARSVVPVEHGAVELRRCVARLAHRVVPLALLVATAPAYTADPEERRNWFNDPFAAATSGFAGCPVPEGPLLSRDEMRREGHARVERGTTCWLAKQCDAPNAYRDDPAINAAVVEAITKDSRLRSASIWVTTQRRFVTLQGCVRDAAQRDALIRRVQAVPRVQYVIDELWVGSVRAKARPPYRAAR